VRPLLLPVRMYHLQEEKATGAYLHRRTSAYTRQYGPARTALLPRRSLAARQPLGAAPGVNRK
jgi:hypothetical protein